MALFLAQAMSSLRWQWILKADSAKIPLKELFSSYMIGMFVNNFMPTSIGGDVIKTYDIYRLTKDSSLSVASVFFERFTGLIALVLLSWIGANSYLFSFSTPVIAGWIFINMACIFVIMSLILKAWGEWILRLVEVQRFGKIMKVIRLSYERLVAYQNRRALLAKLLIISFPIQLLTIIIYQQVAFAIGVSLPFIFFLFTIPFIILISLFPISFGGLGVREGTTVLIFSMAGVSTDAALSISLIYLSIMYIVSLTGGLLLIFRGIKISQMQKIENDLS